MLAGLQRLEVVGVSATAPVFEELTVSGVDAEEESLLHGLAGPWFVLQGAQFVEDEELWLPRIC